MTWWLWLLTGVVLTHVVYTGVLLFWWYRVLRGERTREQIDRNFQLVRSAITDRRRRRTYASDPSPHRW